MSTIKVDCAHICNAFAAVDEKRCEYCFACSRNAMDPQTSCGTHGRIKPSFNLVPQQKPLPAARACLPCQLSFFLLSSHVRRIQPVPHEESIVKLRSEDVSLEELFPFASLEESERAQMKVEDVLEHAYQNLFHAAMPREQSLILRKQRQLSTNRLIGIQKSNESVCVRASNLAFIRARPKSCYYQAKVSPWAASAIYAV